MEYVFVVMYQETQYAECIPVRAFRSEENADDFIDLEYELQPELTGGYYTERIPLE